MCLGKLSHYWFYYKSITMKKFVFNGESYKYLFSHSDASAQPIKRHVPNWDDLHITRRNPKINGYFSLNIRKLFYYKICFLLSANFALSPKWIANSCAYFIRWFKSFSRPGSSAMPHLHCGSFCFFFITSLATFQSRSRGSAGIFSSAILIKNHSSANRRRNDASGPI